MPIRKTASERRVRFQEIIGPLTRYAKIFGGIVRSNPAFILPELHVQYPVQLIFNGPMAAFGFQNLTCSHAFPAINEIMRLFWNLSCLLYLAENNAYPGQAAPFFTVLQPPNVLADITRPALITPVSLAVAYGVTIRV